MKSIIERLFGLSVLKYKRSISVEEGTNTRLASLRRQRQQSLKVMTPQESLSFFLKTYGKRFFLLWLVIVLCSFLLIAKHWFPKFIVEAVSVEGSFRFLTQQELVSTIKPIIDNKNLLQLDLDLVKKSLESLPWVKTAFLRKLWPNALGIRVVEHVPVAFWNEKGVLSESTEVLYPQYLASSLTGSLSATAMTTMEMAATEATAAVGVVTDAATEGMTAGVNESVTAHRAFPDQDVQTFASGGTDSIFQNTSPFQGVAALDVPTFRGLDKDLELILETYEKISTVLSEQLESVELTVLEKQARSWRLQLDIEFFVPESTEMTSDFDDIDRDLIFEAQAAKPVATRIKNTVVVKLGLVNPFEKLNQFMGFYQSLGSQVQYLSSVDLRYRRGLAVRWKTGFTPIK